MKTLIILFLFLISSACFGQIDTAKAIKPSAYSKNSLKVSLGFGSSQNSRARAGGGQVLFGYQRELKKRLRFSAVGTFGMYSTNGNEVVSYDHVSFSSMNAQCLFSLDV